MQYVPILDRPEERSQSIINSSRYCRVGVPILDRPEERSQFPSCHGAGKTFLCAVFQSSIAPKNDRNHVKGQRPTMLSKFQSSIAPKNDRNAQKELAFV